MAAGKLRLVINPGGLIEWDDTEVPVDWVNYSERNRSFYYQNGDGYQITAGQILYEYLSPGEPGYIVIKSLNDIVLSSSGYILVSLGYNPPDPFVPYTHIATVLGAAIILYIQ